MTNSDTAKPASGPRGHSFFDHGHLIGVDEIPSVTTLSPLVARLNAFGVPLAEFPVDYPAAAGWEVNLVPQEENLVAADSDRQRQDRHSVKSWAVPQPPGGVPEVLPQCIDPAERSSQRSPFSRCKNDATLKSHGRTDAELRADNQYR